ncbi:MAG TPA: cyclic nucleotide-binding domain-containing protein [Armatimonadota bacterium]|jgi:ATP-binding cassette subfamily B protein
MPDLIRYPAGDVVIQQGDAGDFFYIITAGTVEIVKTTATGETVRLRTLVAGNHFGEIAFLRDVPRTATVRTVTPCDFYIFTRDEFHDFLTVNPKLRDCIEQEAMLVLRASGDLLSTLPSESS